MKRRVVRVAIAAILAGCVPAVVSAQGASTSSISGTVVDTGGGVIPGAMVQVVGADGTKTETVTNTQGVFTVPALSAGTYKVIVSLTGFKTAEVSDVRVVPNVPANVAVKLEVGQINETITVASSSELVNTQTATVSSTLNSDQLNRMPTPTRNALNAVTFLPGVNTAGTNRNSTINGLPESMMNITLDGVSNNDNFLRSTDGFFASVTPRQDAIEAVTVTTAVNAANMGGSGAITINFQTRSGTNRFSGSGYEYFRHPSLNSNAWVNERVGGEKNQITLNQYGARVGGPLVLPGLYDGRGKSFYFFHYEQLRFPNSFTRTRTTFNPDVIQGFYMWDDDGVERRVNVLDLAAANGQLATPDPTMQLIMNKIYNASLTTGVRVSQADPMVVNYVWQSPGKLFEHQPTLRLDHNITDRHRLSGSTQTIWADRLPDYLNNADARFPGAPNFRHFRSTRPLHSITLRSTLSSNLVNELRGGITALGGQSAFGQPNDPSNGPQSFADIGGTAIVMPLFNDWHTTTGTSWRSVPTYSLDNTVNWQKGRHSLSFGGSILRSGGYENAQTVVPTISLGFADDDPADFMFTDANFPGGDLDDARDIYALLTGRVTGISGQAALDPATNRYVAFGPRAREGVINVYSLFAQDSWRVSPTVTLNLGLRYDLQTPFQSQNDTMSAVEFASICGMSGLGPNTSVFDKCDMVSHRDVGVVPQFVQLTSGTRGYNTDFNNLAPSLMVAWRPNVQEGWLRGLLGDPETATLRAGYSVSYERQGLSTYTGQYGANPGSTLTLTRNQNNMLGPGEAWPVLLTQPERLFVESFPESPTYPIAIDPNRGSDLNAFAPDIEIGYARTWTASFQRSISRDMAVDIRYVGTRGVSQWSELNYNTFEYERNGFHAEFVNAVNNLRANNAAGGTRRGSFAYFGPGSGTQPLPTYLAYLNARTNAGDASAYTGTLWTSTALTNDLVFTNPSITNSINDLDGNTGRRGNAIAAGLPANFFVVNPDVDDANVLDSGAFSDYHALQIDVRRRLSRGLWTNLNYQYALEGGSAFLSFAQGRVMNSSPNVRHAIKTQWDWTIPVGRGQRFGTDMNPWLDGLLGGWSFNGVGRIQAVMVNLGNVRLVGMTHAELQAEYKHIRITGTDGIERIQMLPDDIILNTRRAFSISANAVDGYNTTLGAPEGRYIAPANFDGCIQVVAGDCAPRTVLLRAPWFTRFDVGIAKRFDLAGQSNIEVRFDILNLFDNINFNNAANPGTSSTQFQVTSAYSDASNTYDPGGRLGQLMMRISW